MKKKGIFNNIIKLVLLVLWFEISYSCKSTKETTSISESKIEQVGSKMEEQVVQLSQNSHEKAVKSTLSRTNNLNIELIRDEFYQVTNITFYDKETKQVTSDLDINKQNPYVTRYSENYVDAELNLFSFPNVDINNFVDKRQREIYTYKANQTSVDKGYTTYYTYSNDNFVLLSYNLYLISEQSTIGINSNLTIFNSNGEKIFILEDLEVNCNLAIISDDGAYLCITYGSDDGEQTLLYNGYRIYDIKNKRLIHDRTLNANSFNVAPVLGDDQIFIFYNKPDNIRGFIAYDIEKSVELGYDYRSEFGKFLESVSSSGLIIRNPDYTMDTVLIRRDFLPINNLAK